MKVYVWKDEAYPVYGIDDRPAVIEVPDDLVEWYYEALTQWRAVQEELAEYSCE